MWSTKAKEAKLINDSIALYFSELGDQRGLKNADLLNKSYFLKTPWNVLEICLSEVVQTMC